MRSCESKNPHLATPETCESISIRLAFWLAQGSISFQSFGRISATLVFQVRVDKPAGKGVVLRPCAKSSITIPREAERKAFEQEPMLKSVYKYVNLSVHLKDLEKVRRTSVVILVPFSDLIPHAPSSAGPVLLTMANVKPGIPSASTIFCTDSTKLGVKTLGAGVDRRSLLAAASTTL